MPMYDRKCPQCETVKEDCLEPVTPPVVLCGQCGEPTERVWLQKANAVIGDEIDVEVRHGLCWPDGSPRRFRSREEMNRVAKKKHMTNLVEHKSGKSGDKSRHTTRWT